jgi:hypothetical protein
MSFNGSGTFLINTAGQPVVAGTVISSTAFNALTADLATGLSTVITKDGQTTVTANIPMSTYKFTGLGVGSAAGDSANLSQVQSTVTKLLTSVSGADTITAVGAPVVAAYAAGQMFYFVATGDNTGAVTLNIDALGAKAVTRDGSVALVAGDIKSGEVVVVVYDGTRFQVVSQLNSAGDARFANVSIASSLYVGGVSTFVGNAGFSANVSIASALSVGGVAAITGATTIGGNLTLSGGTANGVLYLNGSKVATSGSALVFDGSNLGVGATATALTTYRGAEFAGTTATTGGFLRMRTSDSSITSLDFTDSNGRAIFTTTNHPVRIGVNDTEVLRFTSSTMYTASGINVGIGTSSPGAKLQVVGEAIVGGGSSADIFKIRGRTSDNFGLMIFENSGGTDTRGYFGSPADNTFAWYDGGFTERMRLDSSGNLGLGVSPSASDACNNFQIGPNGDTISSRILANTPQIALSSNAVGNWYAPTYKVNGYATQYSQQGFDGTHKWSLAPSGTAGNAISFTQAMTLTAAGEFLVGTTTSAYTNAGRGVIEVNGSDQCLYGFRTGGTARGYLLHEATNLIIDNSVSTGAIKFQTNATERARITSGGDLLVGDTTGSDGRIKIDGTSNAANCAVWAKNAGGATSPTQVLWNNGTSGDNKFVDFYTETSATVRGSITYNRAGGLVAYNTTSDYRAKDILGPVQNSGATIDALKVYEGQMKGASQNRPMLVAHEAQEHAPYAVTGEKDAVNEDGTPKYQQMDVSALVPLLLAEIQSLRARVAQLESK